MKFRKIVSTVKLFAQRDGRLRCGRKFAMSLHVVIPERLFDPVDIMLA
jgi:hypothetical protein